jgi:hypothetical protein
MKNHQLAKMEGPSKVEYMSSFLLYFFSSSLNVTSLMLQLRVGISISTAKKKNNVTQVALVRSLNSTSYIRQWGGNITGGGG